MSDLRLEAADKIGGGIDDRFTEFKNGVRPALERGRKSGRIGIEPDAKQGVVPLPGGGQGLGECHRESSFQSTPVIGQQRRSEELTSLPNVIIPLQGRGFPPESVFDEKTDDSLEHIGKALVFLTPGAIERVGWTGEWKPFMICAMDFPASEAACLPLPLGRVFFRTAACLPLGPVSPHFARMGDENE